MSTEIVPVEGSMTTQDVLNQIRMVQDVMARAMQEGEHFGVIPGTGKWNPQTKREEGKKSLLKAGAEKLCLLFRLVPSYQVETLSLPDGHREVRVQCRLTQIGTDRFFGEGIGAATTMESKYRYRNDPIMSEDGKLPKLVPGAYWASRDPELLGGRDLRAQKRGKEWIVVRRVEVQDPADYYNTVAKMAKKRAYVDATISATAASDIFTQDGEISDDLGHDWRRMEGKIDQAIDNKGVLWLLVGQNKLWTRDEAIKDDLAALTGRMVVFQVLPRDRGTYQVMTFQEKPNFEEEPTPEPPL